MDSFTQGLKNNYLKLVLTAIGVVLGYFIKYYLDRRQSAGSLSADFKRTMYQSYVNTILSFHHQKPTTDPIVAKRRTDKFIKDSKNFQKRSILDASPSVIRAITRQIAYFERRQNKSVDDRKLDRKNTKIFKAMRRDIGTLNLGLGRSAAVLIAPVRMYQYESIHHPVWWRIKKQTKRAAIPILGPTYRLMKKSKQKLYSWGAKD